ncbi:MAG TPA: hypothetical protein VFH95_09465 [Candidatus Kapabacteria bacterium]|nr:hypothetical protein [Candidatus Kapabacteria bacterium]
MKGTYKRFPQVGNMSSHRDSTPAVPAGTYFCVIQTDASGRQERGARW